MGQRYSNKRPGCCSGKNRLKHDVTIGSPRRYALYRSWRLVELGMQFGLMHLQFIRIPTGQIAIAPADNVWHGTQTGTKKGPIRRIVCAPLVLLLSLKTRMSYLLVWWPFKTSHDEGIEPFVFEFLLPSLRLPSALAESSSSERESSRRPPIAVSRV